MSIAKPVPATDSEAPADPADRGATCAWCGTTEATMPLTWTTSTERGVTQTYCDRCSREHLRAIEGKLDPAFW